MPIVTGNCYSSGTLIIRPSCTRGSLRDLIYDKSPFSSFIQKCRYRQERLIMPSNAVSTIAVQVLHALAYLHKKRIPYGELTNILIEIETYIRCCLYRLSFLKRTSKLQTYEI